MKKFKDIVRERREQLKMTQADFEGFGQSYVADIESGRIKPSTRKTIIKLAKALRLEMNEHAIDWLWIYSLLDRDPYEVFCHRQSSPNKPLYTIAESRGQYQANQGDIDIPKGTPESEVLRQLGQPDKKVTIATKSRWTYTEDGINVILEQGHVADVQYIM